MEDNIKTDPKEAGYYNLGWTHLALLGLCFVVL
jgi:hypothetical protein